MDDLTGNLDLVVHSCLSVTTGMAVQKGQHSSELTHRAQTKLEATATLSTL